MKQRTITGLILTAFVAVLLWLPGTILATVALILVGFAVWEEYHALTLAGHRPVSWPTWLSFAFSIPLAYSLGHRVLIPIMSVALLLTCICIIFREEPKLVDLSFSVLPLLTVLLPGLSIVNMGLLKPHAKEVVYICMTLAVPLVGDMFAMFAGMKIGGRKLCPAVSPNKTVAGSIGGLVGSLMAALLVFAITHIVCDAATLSILPAWWQYVLLGVIGGVVGQVGDLFASLVKRHSNIKDFSNLFPGHGGMLDRLDSTLFMAVLMYCFMLFA